MISLRDYQREALEAIEREYRQGTRRQLLVLPTGAGKTVVFVHQALKMGRALILEHRDELINQALEKIRLVCPEAETGVVKADRNETGGRITVASVQTLWRPERLGRLPREYDLVVSDEAHHCVSSGWQAILAHVGAGKNCLHLGVTATPNRTDRVGLGRVFDKVVYEKSIAEMIAAGYLCPPKGVVIRTRTDLSVLEATGADFSDRKLEALVNTANRNELIVRAVKEKAMGRRTILFAAGVGHARNLAEGLRAVGVNAASVDAELPLDERRRVLREFHEGRLAAVTNYGVLTEGYDEPSVDCVVLARPTKSSLLYVQMVGRGLRPYPGKRECLVMDVADISGKHRLIQIADLVGDEAGSRSGTGTAVSRAGGEKPGERVGIGGRIVEEEVSLVQTMFNWVNVGGVWLLPGEKGDAWALWPVGDGYKPVHLSPEKSVEVLHGRSLPLDWAQGVVESRLREVLGNLALVRKKARWRTERASEGQVALLKKAGLWSEGMTRGEASDTILRWRWDRIIRKMQVPEDLKMSN